MANEDTNFQISPVLWVIAAIMFFGILKHDGMGGLANLVGIQNLNNNCVDQKNVLDAVIMGNKTKTYAGNWILPIPDFLYPYIVEQMQIANSQENNDEKLLFKPNNSKYTKRGNVNSELHRILEREFNIKDISTHSLRHSYGTRCIESGMAPVVVQKLMGHSDISITLNTYTSVFDKFKQNEIDKVNQYYMNENLITNIKMPKIGNNSKSLEDR